MANNIGYIRISCRSQSEEIQRKDMIAAGVESDFIFCDRSKAKEFSRENLEFIAGESPLLCEGDTLFIEEFNAFGKTFNQILKWADRIVNDLHCNIRVLSNSSMNIQYLDKPQNFFEFLNWAKIRRNGLKKKTSMKALKLQGPTAFDLAELLCRSRKTGIPFLMK